MLNDEGYGESSQLWSMDFVLSKKFLSFINLIPEAVIMSNLEGRIIQVSSEACRLFGYSREEFLKNFG